MKRKFLVVMILSLLSACEKQQSLSVPYEETQIVIENRNVDAAITVTKFVIHQMDFINYQEHDASGGPDLYFSYGYGPSGNISTSIVFNASPAMLPLTFNLNEPFILKNLQFFTLRDYDVPQKWESGKQDLMMYDAFSDPNNHSPYIQFSEENFDGTSYFVTGYDTGSNLIYSIFYTYN